MRQKDPVLAASLDQKLTNYNTRALPGIANPAAKDCLIRQIIDSVRRISYVTATLQKDPAKFCLDPANQGWDPLTAATYNKINNNLDEAFWITFLLTHFGKTRKSKWNLTRSVYGRLGTQSHWTWNRICNGQQGFINWLHANQAALKQAGSFGNHHKYQSLDAHKPKGTGNSILSYIAWIGNNFSHSQKINQLQLQYGNNPRDLFNGIYNDMKVVGFGRTAKFDFLTMVGKLGLINIEPGSTYMVGATGPYDGAKLLFGGTPTRRESQTWLNDLEQHLGLYFGMQVLEDSLCNWQKHPTNYVYFSG